MAGKKMNNKTVTYNNNDNSEKMTRSAYLEGKTELTDEDIIALLDLPSEKYDNNFINHYTDKTYKDLRDVPEEISKLVGILKSKPEYLKYHNTYISKTKILFEQSSTLYNEIPCLIVLNELNKSAYLLPYEFAKGDNDNVRAFADSLKEDVFTDFKRVFAAKIKKSLEGGMKQGQDLFVIINNENLEKGMIKEQLENYEDRRSHKKGLFLFYSEKDYKCYSFEFDEKGILKEEIDYDLKKLRLAISDKPVTPNPRELSSPQSSNLNIQQNQNSVKELFFSLLTRGEIEFFKKADIKQFPDKDKKYKNALKNLQTYEQYMSSQIITNSNTEYYQNEISSRYYQLINNESQINSQGDNTMEQNLRTLNDNWGMPFIAPDYWNDDDISKWNEMTVKDGLNLEIVSMLDFVTEATKVINGEKPLEYINNLDYMKLPKKIESMEELVNQEKEHRNSAYELFQKEYQIETQQNTQEVVADVDDIIDAGVEMMDANGGLSDAAIEAELAAYENPKPDYLDEQGNPHWFDEEEETEVLADEEIEQLNEQQPVSQNKTEFEPLYFGDITENGEANVYTKEQYFEKFGEEPSENDRLDDELVENLTEPDSYVEFALDFTDDADVNPGDFLPVYDGVFNVSEEDQTFLDAMDKEREEHEKWLHETKEGQKKLKEMESEVHEDTKFEGFPVSSQSEINTAKIPDNLQKKAALHKFFVENAYKEKTPVPAFGYRNAKTGHIVVLEGWEFSKTETYTRDVWDEEKQEWKADDKERHGGYNSVTDDLIDGIKKQPQFIKDENGNQIENPDFYTYRKTDPIVVLTKMEGNKQIEMRIPAEQYATQIRNSCILKNAAEITEEKLQEYRQKAQLDENEQRPNNAENFTHNFTAFCRKGANSVQEAMDFAIHNLIGNMRPEEREKLKAQMLDWEKKSGKSYTERLTEEYKQNVSDKPIIDKTAFDRNVLDSIRYNTEVIDREGAKLDKSCKLTVGESVKMQLSVPDCLGRKNYKLPVQNLVLVSHCPDNNSVVLMDEKHLSKYILPRDEFIKNVQKYEKKQERSNYRTSRQEERNAISMSD